MFVVLLRFGENKARAPDLMAGHNEWIKRGVDDKSFILVGSIKHGIGGAIFVNGLSLEEVKLRVSEDPFVAAKVVNAEILEIAPSVLDTRLEFLA